MSDKLKNKIIILHEEYLLENDRICYFIKFISSKLIDVVIAFCGKQQKRQEPYTSKLYLKDFNNKNTIREVNPSSFLIDILQKYELPKKFVKKPILRYEFL